MCVTYQNIEFLCLFDIPIYLILAEGPGVALGIKILRKIF